MRTSVHTPDVVVVGDGLVGLASAVALAEAGSQVCLVGATNAGQASYAGAGMLAPSVEKAGGSAHTFALHARDGYAAYVGELVERSGRSISLDLRGVLQVALEEDAAAELTRAASHGSRWLPQAELARFEPCLGHALGALFHPNDGSVDNRALLTALGARALAHPRIRTASSAAAAALQWEGDRPGVRLADGTSVWGERLVLAAGAWAPLIAGLPRALPVEPVRGQMLALTARPLEHVVYGPGGYLVPRGERTLVGSTMERVAFDPTTTPEGLARIREAGDRICPALAGTPVHERWAGLRPMTPDGLPIIGPDPDRPALIYACGHSRNGILLAPLTGACVAALALGQPSPEDLSPFSVTRFASAARQAH